MFVSSLNRSSTWNRLLQHRVWEKSLAWIQQHAATAAPGKYELGEPGWFVGVDAYTTKPAPECQWENHTRTIDLQFLIEGVEGIGVISVDLLGEPVLYREESDTQKFAVTGLASSLVVLRPGDFVIFTPGDAHCPKIAVGDPAPLRKLVIKIPAALLAEK